MSKENKATAGTQPETANMSMAAMAAGFQRKSAGTQKPAGAKDEPGDGKPGSEHPDDPEPELEPNNDKPETDPELDSPENTDPEAPETDPEEQPGEDPETDPEPEKARISQEVLDAIAEAKLPKSAAKMVRRIHRLVDERDGERNDRLRLERENHQLKAQAKQGGGARKPGAANLSKHPEMEALNNELEETTAALSWLEANPDGGEVTDEKGKAHTITAEQAQKQKAQLETKRTKLLGKQGALETKLEEQNKQRQVAEVAEAAKQHPWLKDKQSKQFEQALDLFNRFEGIENIPGFVSLLADAVAFRNMKVKSGERQPLIPRKPPAEEPTPQPGKPPTSAPKVDGKQKTVNDAEQQFEKTGSGKDLAKLFAKRRQAGRA